MPNLSIYFLCPDLTHPSGGIRVIYRHVDVLRSAQHNAFVVHHSPGYRPSWFRSDTPILTPPVDIRPADILVFPEVEVEAFASAPQKIRKVIYAQNPYYMFRKHSIDPTDNRTPYTHPDTIAAVVVSEDARQYVAHVFHSLVVYRVFNSISSCFAGSVDGKKKQICFMPRKHFEDVQQVLNILKFRGCLKNWKLAAIDNVTEEQVAQIMRESAVFLSFGYPEGFGLPAAEAMACGCVTIGYHGNGGREFMRPEWCFPIEVGDILGFARTVEAVLRRLDEDLGAFDAQTQKACSHIRENYSIEGERRSVLEAWTRILGQMPNQNTKWPHDQSNIGTTFL